ncbi:MAG TPA: heparan-alpha-glucosaminide N-acetyltransferase domain-containing protein, partial [Thermoanaerobaculia bacterium]|nr:heparan-alpha-glucosaminide N-acetyltransferase domain-containing protein [Thermoanaerobaculia bacterium]
MDDGVASGRPVAGVPETRSTSSRRSHRRLRGVDAARAIAVLGMVMVHFGPNPTPDTALGNLYGVSHGRASVLFALLAGVGVALLVGDRSRGRPSLVRGRLVVRGALLLPLGLWLQGLDHGALVILQYYAIYFLFAAFVFTLPDRWLLAGGVVVLVGGPLVYLWSVMVAPQWFTGDPASLDDPAGKIALDLLLTGKYPLVTWAAPLLVGLWIGRRNLAAPPVRWWLLVIGATVAVSAAFAADWLATAFGETFEEPGAYYWFANLINDRPHSQMPLWMLGSIGSACAVLGGMLLLADWLPRMTWPLAATGQLALTVYVGHLLLLDAYPEL